MQQKKIDFIREKKNLENNFLILNQAETQETIFFILKK